MLRRAQKCIWTLLLILEFFTIVLMYSCMDEDAGRILILILKFTEEMIRRVRLYLGYEDVTVHPTVRF